MSRLRLALWTSVLFALPSYADEVLTRALAAREAAKQRGPVKLSPVDGGVDTFVPVPLAGASCAAGLRLNRDKAGNGMCDGYSTTIISLSIAYPGEPEPTSFGPNGARDGLPVSYEAGLDLEMESYQCSRAVGILSFSSVSPEENRRHAEEQQKAADAKHEACMVKVKAAMAKERRWHRCELLAIDACRREAFLECRGNEGPRGLVRATWSRPKDRPANETLVVTPVREP